ncbi:MAG: hypothetical protein CM15mP103_07110 [Gammaproteobacteria bacterium]|nr:MAG: hypothetical protein CM15mP103_07110 [Gammaproteobacteria bacterium]
MLPAACGPRRELSHRRRPGSRPVLSQDAAFLPSVQEGMRSKAFRGQLWGEQEQRLRISMSNWNAD